jgi:hypothetical protein
VTLSVLHRPSIRAGGVSICFDFSAKMRSCALLAEAFEGAETILIIQGRRSI